jgi:hypothetical protein
VVGHYQRPRRSTGNVLHDGNASSSKVMGKFALPAYLKIVGWGDADHDPGSGRNALAKHQVKSSESIDYLSL